MGLEKRLERIANHSSYPEDLPSSVNEDAAAALCAIKRLGAENDRLKADLRSYEITFGMMHDTAAERDVLAERARQKADEGYDAKHDDGYLHGQLGKAAACYALTGSGTAPRIAAMPPGFWPWDLEWWKPTTDRRDLVKAGALILAEIERLDRAALSNAEGRSLSSASGQEADHG